MRSSYSGSVMGPKMSSWTLPRMFMPAPWITRILGILFLQGMSYPSIRTRRERFDQCAGLRLGQLAGGGLWRQLREDAIDRRRVVAAPEAVDRIPVLLRVDLPIIELRRVVEKGRVHEQPAELRAADRARIALLGDAVGPGVEARIGFQRVGGARGAGDSGNEQAADGAHQQKTPALSRVRGFRLVYGVAVTYFRMRMHTIIGANSFHSPVRDGKAWFQ